MMLSNRRAGALHEKIAFLKPNNVTDALGGRTTDFDHQFERRAAFRHLRGGEGVMEGRLAGRHAIIITTRRCAQTRLVDRSWRIEDTRSNEVYDVKDISPSEDRMWLEFLCELRGGAGG